MVLYTGVGSINLATIVNRTFVRWLRRTEILAKQSDVEVQHHYLTLQKKLLPEEVNS